MSSNRLVKGENEFLCTICIPYFGKASLLLRKKLKHLFSNNFSGKFQFVKM